LEIVEDRLEPGPLLSRCEDAPFVADAELADEDRFAMGDGERIRPIEPARRTHVVHVCAHPVDVVVAGEVGGDVGVDSRLEGWIGRIAVDDPRPRNVARTDRTEDVDDASPRLYEIGRGHPGIRERTDRPPPRAVELPVEECDQYRLAVLAHIPRVRAD